MARTATTVWAAAGLLIAANAALAAPFAMITDLKGEAWAIEGEKPRKLSMLGYIENPTEVKVDPAAKLAITYFANGMQYNFAGPARVALESAAPKVIDGRAADAKKITPEKSIGGGLSSDQWRRLQQATVVMRNVKSSFSVVGPDKTAVLAREPEFEWTSAAGAKGYRLVVYGPDNAILHEEKTEQNSLKPALALQPGKRYRWKVDALGVTKPVSASGAFIIADDAARERMAEMKRTAGADLGPRSFYATTLEAEGHQHDARAEWKALAREYPNEPEIVQRGR
jgi:hypothetical protein